MRSRVNGGLPSPCAWACCRAKGCAAVGVVTTGGACTGRRGDACALNIGTASGSWASDSSAESVPVSLSLYPFAYGCAMGSDRSDAGE
jgi:hypothetical protein